MNGLVFLSDVSKVYRSRRREVTAVDRVTLGLDPGQIVCLVGESGSGKSTIGRIVTGLTDPTAGDLKYGNVSARSMSRRELKASRLAVQLIHQDPYASLNPGMTVGATLAAPLKRHQGLAGRALSRRIRTLLEDVGLTPSGLFEPKLPHELSGGQRQRVVIARSLTVDPKVLVADEALSMLDVSIRVSVLQMLRRLCDDRELAVLFITHDLAVARQFGDGHTVAVMQHGRILEHRDTATLVADPEHDYTRALLRAARHEGLRSRHSPNPRLISETEARATPRGR